VGSARVTGLRFTDGYVLILFLPLGGDYILCKQPSPMRAGGGMTLAQESKNRAREAWTMRDSDVRTALRRRLEAEHVGDPNTLIVDEMGVWSGTVRIDMAVINGEICGYELKSDRDTLTRLPMQAEVYSRVFDKVILVVGDKHARKARGLIPKWWGVTLARFRAGELKLIDDRAPKQNPARDPYLVAELLSKDEAIAALDQHGLADGWRSKRVREIHERLAAELPLDVLSERVRIALRARQGWLGNNCPGVLNVPVDAVADPLG